MLDPLKFVDLNRNLDTAESFWGWLVANHEEIRNLGLVAAAIIGFFLLFWRGVSLARSSKAAAKQAENASKSHVADTFTRAIEQLGAVDKEGEPNPELRLGGLYALEKIAKANEDYHPQIMEVLCTYIRLHCPVDYIDPQGPDQFEEIDPEHGVESLRIDIQACLTVLGRRNKSFKNEILDLSGSKIRGALLLKANLNEANLSWADLRMANLNAADLLGADLSKANLTGANLSTADLRNTNNLTCKQIQSAKFDQHTQFPDYISIILDKNGIKTCKMVPKNEEPEF